MFLELGFNGVSRLSTIKLEKNYKKRDTTLAKRLKWIKILD